ncbi:MAG: hypothetical protein ACO4AI_05175 [Prochlorothrix sp.]
MVLVEQLLYFKAEAPPDLVALQQQLKDLQQQIRTIDRSLKRSPEPETL